MSTPAFVGIENEDGTVDYVCCRCDGYPMPEENGVGYCLACHYQDPKKVRQLLSRGDLLDIGPAMDPPEGVPHTFYFPAEGVCVFYSQTEQPPRRAESASRFAELSLISGVAFAYLLTPQGWKWQDSRYTKHSGVWHPLLTEATA